MSEQAFKDARGQLAFSQGLVDKMKQGQPSDMGQQQPMQNSVPVQEEAPTEQPEDIKNTITETLKPFMEKIESLVSKEDEKVRQVEIKLDGEMKPSEEVSE